MMGDGQHQQRLLKRTTVSYGREASNSTINRKVEVEMGEAEKANNDRRRSGRRRR